MNKFLTFPGKQPVYLGDIDFMQTAVKQAFQNLLKNITGRSDANGILSGVEISYQNNSATWTAGVVSLGGEILPVAQGVVGGITTGLYFDIVSSASGGRTFGNGESHDCWETRSAVLTTTVTDYPLSSVPRIEPPSVVGATVYAFDDVANLYDRYAKLAYCGGSFVLAIRQPAQSEVAANYFEGDISGLPEALLNKFTAPNAPQNVMATVRQVGHSSLDSIVQTLQISWTVSSSKLHIVIAFPLAMAFTNPTEIIQVLPIF